VIYSEQEYLSGKYEFLDLDDYEKRTDEYLQSIGFLALMSGRMPHEIFDDPNWNETILFDLRCSNVTFKVLLDLLKLR
jgi:hypothetical protein